MRNIFAFAACVVAFCFNTVNGNPCNTGIRACFAVPRSERPSCLSEHRRHCTQQQDPVRTSDSEFESAPISEQPSQASLNRILKGIFNESSLPRTLADFVDGAPRDVSTRWPNATMPYEFAFQRISHRSTDREYWNGLVTSAMREIESVTCFKFRPCVTEDTNCVVFNITDILGCRSQIGRKVFVRRQQIELGDLCVGRTSYPKSIWRIVHELMHAMGFWHEHSRPDRDHWVDIDMNKVPENQKHNYYKTGPNDVTTLGLPYDYDSITHYPESAYLRATRNTNGIVIGQEDHLSAGDIKKIKRLYRCGRGSTRTTHPVTPSPPVTFTIRTSRTTKSPPINPPPLPTYCTKGQFQCDNRQCVASSKRNDGNHDCSDKSDERCWKEGSSVEIKCAYKTCTLRVNGVILAQATDPSIKGQQRQRPTRGMSPMCFYSCDQLHNDDVKKGQTELRDKATICTYDFEGLIYRKGNVRMNGRKIVLNGEGVGMQIIGGGMTIGG